MRLKKSIVIIFITLIFALSACKKAGSDAVVANGGFDDGASSWTTEAYYPDDCVLDVVSDPEHGNIAHIRTDDLNDARFIQQIPVEENTAYRITCIVRTSGVEDGAGANIGVYGVAACSRAVTGDSGWQTLEFVGKTVSGQKTLAVSVGIGGHGSLSKGEAWFDDVKIEKAHDDAKIEAVFGTAAPAKSSDDTKKVPTEFPTNDILIWCGAATLLFLLLWLIHVLLAQKPMNVTAKGGGVWIAVILIIALAVRVALSLIFYGHKTDINCFTHWGYRVIRSGPAHFYEQWCDYPPGYMLILGAMSWINDLVGGNADIHALMVKIPCIIADLGCAYLVYRYAVKTMNRKAAVALMAVVAFTPVMAYVSSAWGQIDQALAVTLIVPILLLYKRRPIWAGLVYGLGIIMKPQALMCGPLFAAAYLLYVIKGNPYEQFSMKKGMARLFRVKKDSVKLRFFETVAAVIAAFAVIILVSAPFRGDQGTFWLVEKYYGTATSYEYATVNAYNFWALIGANWKKVDVPFMGLTYGKWGTLFMAASVIVSIGLYVLAVVRHKRCKGALPLTMAYLLTAIFTFGHYMHERYIFPALMLLMFAYVFYNDWRVLVTYVAYATTMLVNCAAAFYYSKLFEYGLYWDERIIYWCSLANVALFIWFTYVTIDLTLRNKPLRGYNG